MPPSRWDAELRNAGFAGAQSVVYDDEQPYQINFTLVTTSTASPAPPARSRQVTLLHAPGQDAAVERLRASLLAAGITAVPQTLADAPPADGRDVLAILDLAAPFFADIGAPALAAFQAYLAALGAAPGSPGVLWVTRPAQAGCRDARYGQSIGIARTVRSELSLAFGTLEVADGDAAETTGAVVRVYEHFAAARRAAAADAADAPLDPDYEYAFFGRRVHVPRFRWVGVADRLCAAVQDAPKKLDIGRMGQLRTLQWVEERKVEEAELGADEVEVEPRAVGMNFKVWSTGRSEENWTDSGTVTGRARGDGNRQGNEARTRSRGDRSRSQGRLGRRGPRGRRQGAGVRSRLLRHAPGHLGRLVR